MTKTKHTPGPWKVNHKQHGMLFIGSDTMPVAMTSRGIDKGNESEDAIEADARLIAAAPDLLAALESCQFLLESAALKSVDPTAVDERSAAIGKARAAIAKAGGR